MRFLLHPAKEGNEGQLVWGDDQIPALIDGNDPVVQHGLRQRIKYVRLIRRKASSPQARGTDSEGRRYVVQLVLEGLPYQKPKNQAGTDTIGLDIGPSSLAIFPRKGQVQLKLFCEELKPDARKKRRLERKMDRQRRANNPQNYDEQGRVKRGQLTWKESHRNRATRRQHATDERKLAAHLNSNRGERRDFP